jgi:hypothetical protein
MPDLLERIKSALADRYAVESEIGRGGMAAVFLAEDLKHHPRSCILRSVRMWPRNGSFVRSRLSPA